MSHTNLRLLVVDDSSSIRRIMRALLNTLGFVNITEAEDGVNALGILREQPIDIILSDWNMPNMNGIELLRAVRTDPALLQCPFLMITAEASQENILVATQAGANGYIIKPFSAATLKRELMAIQKIPPSH